MKFPKFFGEKSPTKTTGTIVTYDYSQNIERLPTNTMSSSKSSPVYTLDMIASLNGRAVTQTQALGVEAFYSCIQDQCGTIGALPLKMYRTTLLKDQPERVRSGQEYRVFTEQPCEYLSIQGFLEMLVVSYRTIGAFYALPFRDSKGRINEIIPFANQNSVRPMMGPDGNVYYTYVTNDGRPFGPIPGDQMFIIKNITTDGYTPVRPLYYQAGLLDMAINQDDNYATLQSDGITAQMALGTDSLFDDKNARERLKDDFKKFRGPSGVKEIPILEQGLKPISLNLTPQEMDLLNQREFTVKRVCAINETMPHRIGAETMKTSDKIYELDEAQFKKWNPLMTKIEREFSRIAGRYLTLKMDRKALYAGSPYRLVEAVEREYKGGLASLAESREDLGRDFIPGTEEIFVIRQNNCIFGKLSDMEKVNQIEDGSDEQQNNSDS